MNKQTYASLSPVHADDVLRDTAVLLEAPLLSMDVDNSWTQRGRDRLGVRISMAMHNLQFPGSRYGIDMHQLYRGLCDTPVEYSPANKLVDSLRHIPLSAVDVSCTEDAMLVNRDRWCVRGQSHSFHRTEVTAALVGTAVPALAHREKQVGKMGNDASDTCFDVASQYIATRVDALLRTPAGVRALNEATHWNIARVSARASDLMSMMVGSCHFSAGPMAPALHILLSCCKDVPDSVIIAAAGTCLTLRDGLQYYFPADECAPGCNDITPGPGSMLRQIANEFFYKPEYSALSSDNPDIDTYLRTEEDAHWMLDRVLGSATVLANPGHRAKTLAALWHRNLKVLVGALLRTYRRYTMDGLLSTETVPANQFVASNAFDDTIEWHGNLRASVLNVARTLKFLEVAEAGMVIGLHLPGYTGEEREVSYLCSKPQAYFKDDVLHVRDVVTKVGINKYWAGIDCRKYAARVRNSFSPQYLLSIPAKPEFDRLWWGVYESGPHSCMTGYSYETCPVRVYCHEDSELYLHVRYSGTTELDMQGLLALINPDTGEIDQDSGYLITGRAIGKKDSYIRGYGSHMDGFLTSRGIEGDDEAADEQPGRLIPHPDEPCRILMPYLDGGLSYFDFSDDQEHVIFTARGDYDAENSSGHAWDPR